MKKVLCMLLLAAALASCKKEGEPKASIVQLEIPGNPVAPSLPQLGAVSWGCVPTGECHCYQYQGFDYFMMNQVWSVTADQNCAYASPFPEAYPGSKSRYPGAYLPY